MRKPLDNYPRHELLAMRQKALNAIAFYEAEHRNGGIIDPKHLIPYHQVVVREVDRLLARGFDVV